MTEVVQNSHVVYGIKLRANTQVRSSGGALSADWDLLNEDISAILAGLDIATNKGYGRGLARSVRSKKGKYFAMLHTESDIVNGRISAEGLGEMLDLETVIFCSLDSRELISHLLIIVVIACRWFALSLKEGGKLVTAVVVEKGAKQDC